MKSPIRPLLFPIILLAASTSAFHNIITGDFQTYTPGTLSLTAPGTFCAFADGTHSRLEPDGNIVIFHGAESDPHPVEWASNKTDPNCQGAGCQLYFQTDGNLVSYSGSTPLFWTATTGRGAVLVCAERLSYMMIFDAGGNLIWYALPFAGYQIFQYTCPQQLTAPWECVT